MTENKRIGSVAALYVATLLGLVLITSACAPKDEKVSNRTGGFSGSGGGGTAPSAKLGDRGAEYSRSMLIELADVSRQLENALASVKVSAAPEEGSPITLLPPAIGSVLTVPNTNVACQPVTLVRTAAGSLQYSLELKGCKEAGPTFEGAQYGREHYFAAIDPSAPTVATTVKVEGKGIETVLKPNVNPKDTLRTKSYRFLEAQLLSQDADRGELTYRFTYENHGTYSLDLKAFFDNGSMKSSVSGVLIVNAASGRVTKFRAVESVDRMSLRVESARQSRQGGPIVRQEFYGSGQALELGLDGSGCALPAGAVKSRFTVKPLVKDGKYVIDSTTDFEATATQIAKAGAAQKPIAAKVCSSDRLVTITEFYAGLLY